MIFNSLNKMSSYKNEHQIFLTGHSGTSFFELVWLLSSVFLCCPLRDATQLWGKQKGHGIIRFFSDFLILVVFPLCFSTILNENILCIFISLLITTSLQFFLLLKSCGWTSVKLQLNKSNQNLNQQKVFITYFRSILSIFTSLVILGVDFPVFPRRYAKTEEYGFGMMDFGVGFFVISNAIVSREARGKENLDPTLLKIKKAFTSPLPLIILGIIRLISVKGTDYQEHLTEYGVHWNFFFSLAAIKILGSILLSMIPSVKPGISGILILLGHQILLSSGLSTYIIYGADGKKGRTSFIDCNREGILSLPGYIALYMIAVQLGRIMFKKRDNLWDWLKAAFYLSGIIAGTTCIMFGLHLKIEPVSRRFANAAYVMTTIILSCIALLICLLTDIGKSCIIYCQEQRKERTNITDSISNPNKNEFDKNTCVDEKVKEENNQSKENAKELCLLQAVSYNSLLFFLLANLMTGLVNMSVSTIYASTPRSMLILGLYSFSLCFIFVVLYLKNIKTKIW